MTAGLTARLRCLRRVGHILVTSGSSGGSKQCRIPHPAARYLGLLATTLDRFNDAERHLINVIAMNERMGAHAFTARTRYDYANLLAKRDADGDRERALALTSQALAAEHIGMTKLAGEALALKVRLQSILRA